MRGEALGNPGPPRLVHLQKIQLAQTRYFVESGSCIRCRRTPFKSMIHVRDSTAVTESAADPETPSARIKLKHYSCLSEEPFDWSY